MNLPKTPIQPPCTIRITTWQADKEMLQQVRYAVFVEEQGIPAELEWDDQDREAVHVLAVDEFGQSVATGRLLTGGKIGRMAVLPGWRHKGIGRSMLKTLLDAARDRGDAVIHLSSQQSASGFYVKQGFVQTGEAYLEAGKLHVAMQLTLQQDMSQQNKTC